MLISHIYVLGGFVNFLVIFRYIYFSKDWKNFFEDLVFGI